MRDALNERAEPIQRQVRVNARPEIVFAHFTDPERYVRWKGRRAWLDPRPGGIFRVDINGRDVARGEFLESFPTGGSCSPGAGRPREIQSRRDRAPSR